MAGRKDFLEADGPLGPNGLEERRGPTNIDIGRRMKREEVKGEGLC